MMFAASACSAASRTRAATSSPSPLVITAEPASIHPLSSRVVARIPIDNPDGLTEVGEAIWVKTDDGRAVRIDPKHNKVTGSIRLDTATESHQYCQGIGTDGTSVWACAATDTTTNVVRVDPAKLTVKTTAAADKMFDQLTLPHTSKGFWVLSGNGRALSLVSAAGTVTSYPLRVRCLQVAAGAKVVVATCAADNVVVAIDPTSGRVRGQVHLSAPRLALVTDQDVWVDTADGLTRLSLDLKKRAVFPNQYAGLGGDLAFSGNDLWVRGPGGVLWRIDQSRNAVVEKLTTDQPISGGSLLVTADALWASAGDEGYLLRLSR
jgi:hypothetical protein